MGTFRMTVEIGDPDGQQFEPVGMLVVSGGDILGHVGG